MHWQQAEKKTHSLNILFKDEYFLGSPGIFLSSITHVIHNLQVLSLSIANTFKTLKALGIMRETEETVQFCQMFDKYFDMLNTRAIDKGVKSRKPDLKVYANVDDFRFQVHF